MPIKVPNNLPAVETLTEENVFVMTDKRAMTQDIRPLHILLLNLMPTKIDTETQLTRLLGNTPLQIELELLQTGTHKSKNTSQEHMLAFYKTFEYVKDNFYDGMIITGAPVELMEFEEVEYWDELCEIMEWSKSHVHSTFHICWGAQAGLYYHYGIKKRIMKEKLSGVYEHILERKNGMLFRGFDDTFYVPHSRNTTVSREDIEKIPELEILSSGEKPGVFAVKSKKNRQIFIMGHSEYDWDTLQREYLRDKNAGLNPKVPDNYYPNDDDTETPSVKWRSCANLLFSNWLNYFVYQSTPYDISTISQEDLKPFTSENVAVKVAKFGGSSLADLSQVMKVKEIVEKDSARKFIVVSAPGKRTADDTKVTDLLIEASEDNSKTDKNLQIIKERFQAIACDFDLDEEVKNIKSEFIKNGNKDYLVSRGEYLTSKVIAKILGYDFVDAEELIIFDANGEFILEDSLRRVNEVLSKHENAVIPGFYGSDSNGSIVTFSRGGSDLSGAVITAGIKAGLYENWTDVSGMLLADPQIVDNPLPVPLITYKELRELSAMGAQVMHEDVVFPVRKMGIPINIRNTNHPKAPGTLIANIGDERESLLKISGISGGKGYAGFLIEKDRLSENLELRSKVMDVFSKEGISINNVVSGIDSLNIFTREENVKGKISRLEIEIKSIIGSGSVTANTGISLIAVVSRHMAKSLALGAKVLTALANRNINVKMVDYGVDGVNTLIGVDNSNYEKAVKAIYREFIKK